MEPGYFYKIELSERHGRILQRIALSKSADEWEEMAAAILTVALQRYQEELDAEDSCHETLVLDAPDEPGPEAGDSGSDLDDDIPF